MIGILYARVSTDEQARDGFSLASQLESCRKRALSIGATDLIECVDEGVSGEILNRPGLMRARDLIRQGGIGAFICLDPDRFARNLSHQLLVTEEIERANVRLEFINFDWKNTPEGKLFYSLRGAIAEFEKEKIRERTNRGKLQKAKQGGLPHWPGTYGYTYTRRDGKRDGFVTINEDQADVVRQMFQWFISEDMGYHAIAERLNESGIPGPKGGQWVRPTVKRLLTCTTYKGDMLVNRHDTAGLKHNRYKAEEERIHRRIRPKEEWIRLQTPPIVDEVTWAVAQEKASEVRRLHANKSTAPYLLSGLVRCAVCGATIHGNLITCQDGKKKPYYTCTARSPGIVGQPKCALPFISRDEVDDQVWDTIKSWLSDPQYLAKSMRRQNPAEDHQVEIARLEKRLADTAKERIRLIDLLQKGLVPAEEISARLVDIKRRHDQALARLEDLTGAKTAAPTEEITAAALRHLADELGTQLDDLPFERKREVVRLLIEQVILGQDSLQIAVRIPSFLAE